MATRATALHFMRAQASTITGTGIPVQARDGSVSVARYLGDFDGDGDVDIIDVQRIAFRWGKSCGDPDYDPLYDLDADCDIDIIDVQPVAFRWGTRYSPASFQPLAVPSSLPPAGLSVQPYSQTVSVGQVFTVGVVVTDAVDLGGLEFSIGYDGGVVEVITTTVGSFPGSTGRIIMPLGPTISPSAGAVTFGAFSLGSTPTGPSGNGILAVVTLRAVASGQTALVLGQPQIVDRTGNPQPVIAQQDGQVVIKAPPIYRLYLPLVIKDSP